MKKTLLSITLLASSMVAFANVNALNTFSLNEALLQCCTASTFDEETGAVIQSVTVCGGETVTDYIMNCNKAGALLKIITESPQ